MNTTVLFSLLSAVMFTMAGFTLILRKKNIELSAGVFIPLFLAVGLYDVIVIFNFLEHSGITDYFDPLEDIAEIVFILVFLFFVNNWPKDRSEARFRAFFKLAPMSLAEVTRDGRIVRVNDILVGKLNEFYGITPDALPTMDEWWHLAYPDPEYRKAVSVAWRESVAAAYESGAEIRPIERDITCRDGSRKTMLVNAAVIGENLLFSMVDITDRKKEDAERLENLEMLRATFDTTPDGILVVNTERNAIQANRQFYEMWRIPEPLQKADREASLRKFVLDQLEDPDGFYKAIKPPYQSRIQEMFEIELKDGRVFECYTAPMVLKENDIGRVWDFRDVSKRKNAEAEQEKLQLQLLQAQKLEAVGILAGGVAHDFNNMLGAIMGYAELTMHEMDSANPFREKVARILDAAQRSASLTRQLLIFARKQAATPMVIDLNASVESMLKMLRRLIGENIELEWLPREDNGHVKMDPSQLDQILANLCVNAKEAISDVGRITIKTSVVRFDETGCKSHVDCMPGEYVLLSITDDGSGMDKKTLQHVFEPFFTTKEEGKGTGLGLATVYGIVKQNKGFINLYSEPGTGTTFNIYLPAHSEKVIPEQERKAEAIPYGRGETILMVEDDATIIDMSRMMLERLDYNVLAATTPGEALRMVKEDNGGIHLFLVDVVMPEMNGRELVARLVEVRPDVKYLYMSGYTSEAIIHRGIMENGGAFIQKPFSLKDIAFKIREILENK